MWENHHVTLRTFLGEWSAEERAFYIGSALAEGERAEKARGEAQNRPENGGSARRVISGEELMRRKAQGG